MAAAACATEGPPAVVGFEELPDFAPHEEYVLQLNRKLPIMSEGSGAFDSGERFYYVAYVTEENVPYPESDSHLQDPLWGEMQALWKTRRRSVDPADFEFLIMDARAFPGTPGSPTRRVLFVSQDGGWYEGQVARFVFEYGAEIDR